MSEATETPTPVPVEPGKETSEGKLVLAVAAYSVVGLVFAGLLALSGKLTVDQFISLFEGQMTFLAPLAGIFTGFRTWRKNSAQKTEAGSLVEQARSQAKAGAA